MASRAARSAIVLVLLVVLAGCGGGDPTAFASATDRTCRDLGAAVTALRADAVEHPAASERAALSGALRRYATRVGAAADRLAAVKPPRADRAFGTRTVAALRAHEGTMRSAAAAANRGRVGPRVAADLRRAGPAALPAIPDAVLADAPACRVATR